MTTKVYLEQLNLDGLRELARQHELDIRGTRAQVFDRLADHFERSGWPEQIGLAGPNVMEGGILISEDAGAGANIQDRELEAQHADRNVRRQNSERAINVQEIVQAVVQALEASRFQSGEVRGDPERARRPRTPSSSGNGSQPITANNWNQIKFTSKLIPEFAGKEDQNVVTWLERCVSIARIYQVPEETLILAAINQLSKRALDWYNRQPVETVATWEDFKFQIRSYFERKESVTMTLSRINNRIWRMRSESFIDYAEDKLKLMQFLKLTEREKIELLADEVKEPTLRRFALDARVNTVTEFLEHIRRITEDNIPFKRLDNNDPRQQLKRTNNTSDKLCSHCKKPGHLVQNCRTAKITCFRCGQVGHYSSACPSAKSEFKSTLNHLAQEEGGETSGEPESSEAASSNVCVIENKTSFITVHSLGRRDKAFCALVDTGSPVSLVKKSIYDKFLNVNKLLQVKSNLHLKGINNSVIKIYGKIQIILEKLEGHWFDISLLVVDDNTISFDMLLGRDFLCGANIRLIYQNGSFKFEYTSPMEEEINIIFSINVTEKKNKWDVICDHLDKDLDPDTKNQLLQTFEDELMYKQLTDVKLKELAENVELRGSKYFTIIDGILFRNYKDKNLFVIPESMVNSVIRMNHDDTGHVGVEKTMHGILSHYWFPCLKLKVRQYIENCVKCLTYSLTAGKSEGELQIVEKDETPFKIVHMDHFGPLEETANGFKYILVIIDACTKYVWLFATKSTGTNEVINNLTTLFSIFGLPQKIISDRGTAFSSNKFADFVKEREIKHVMTAVASPWANGQVERVNRFLKTTLSKTVNDPCEWKLDLYAVQHIINNTLNKSINSTPSKLLLGYEQRCKDDKNLRLLIDKLRDMDLDYSGEREKARELARVTNRKLQEYNKMKYDQRHKKNTLYKEGDLILIKVLQHKPGTNVKLAPKYKGPYQVKAVLNKNRFVITDIPGYNLTQKPLNTILSADKLKPWIRIGKQNVPNEIEEISDEHSESSQSE